MLKKAMLSALVALFAMSAIAGEWDSALLECSRKGDLQGVKNALARKAKVGVTDDYKDTPLAHAAEMGHPEIVKLLLSKGADPNTKNKFGDTPLHWASYNGNIEVVKALVAAKANIKAENYLNYTPFICAVVRGHLECVEYLYGLGTDINARDKIDMTPLIRLTYQKKEYEEVAAFLISKGADVNAECQGGFRALHYAAMNGHRLIAMLLLEHGAKINARSFENDTALDMSIRQRRVLMKKYLISRGGKRGNNR